MKRRVTVSVPTALAYVVALCLGAPTAGAAAPLDNNLAALWTKILQTPTGQNPFGSGGLKFACVNLDGTVAPFTPDPAGVPSCTVNTSTKIYVAASSFECSTFPGDSAPKTPPPFTEDDLRKCAVNNDVKVTPTVTLDDKSVPVTEVGTPLLNIVLPNQNLFGQPAGTKGQSVGHGWVTLLDPLTKGTHTIEIENHKSPKITTTIVVNGP
jgi:hypothetical protein